MKKENKQALLDYVETQTGSVPQYSIFRRGAIPTTVTMSALAIAYLLGRSPPTTSQIVYQEESRDVPIVKTIGYDKEHFSSVNIESKGDAALFHPTTAVKKWDGRDYAERSRQIQQLFVTPALHETSMNFDFPSEPQRLMVGGRDFSSFVSEKKGRYQASIPLKDTILLKVQEDEKSEAEQQASVQKDSLEVIVYYKSDDSAAVDEFHLKQHMEDAERYVIKFLEVK